jgi:hypothetical protein
MFGALRYVASALVSESLRIRKESLRIRKESEAVRYVVVRVQLEKEPHLGAALGAARVP